MSYTRTTERGEHQQSLDIGLEQAHKGFMLKSIRNLD